LRSGHADPVAEQPAKQVPERPFASLALMDGGGVDPDVLLSVGDYMAGLAPTPDCYFRLELAQGEIVLVVDHGDHLRVCRPPEHTLRGGGPPSELEEAVEEFASKLARHTDADTRNLVELVRASAYIHHVERTKEAARPGWSVDEPTRFISELLNRALKLKAKLGGGMLTETAPRDTVVLTCLWLRSLLIRPCLLDQNDPQTCTRCSRLALQARWAHTHFIQETEAERTQLCPDCADRIPRIIAQQLFSRLPYENAAITSLFRRRPGVELKEYFRVEFDGVVAAIRAGLKREGLLVERDISRSALHRTYEIADHYAHVPLEQALLQLGAPATPVSRFLRPWQAHVDRARKQQVKRKAEEQ
jgi:hypothetical protein